MEGGRSRSAGAVAIAVGLVAAGVVRIVPGWVGRLAAASGIAWGAVSLIAFYVARTSSGWFGFTDNPA